MTSAEIALLFKRVGFFLLDSLKVYGLYLVIVVVGTGILMFLADTVGYLSYSDRPGPGWHGFHPVFSLQDGGFILGFILFTAYLSVLFIVFPALMLVTVAIRRLRIHRVIIILVLTPLFAVATFWLFAAAGWYVAIGSVFVLVGTALSILFSVAVSDSTGLQFGKVRIKAF